MRGAAQPHLTGMHTSTPPPRDLPQLKRAALLSLAFVAVLWLVKAIELAGPTALIRIVAVDGGGNGTASLDVNGGDWMAP